MEKNEQRELEGKEQRINRPEISKEEVEAANACGLKDMRQYGEKVYQLFDVALKTDTAKCQHLLEGSKELKLQGIPCKIEEKAQVIALYIRVK